MDTNVTADAVNATAPPPVVEPVTATVPTTAVDPVEAKVKEILAKERAAILQEATRLGQSAKDKRITSLQQELQEAKARTQALESALNVMPNLGPDADPSVVNSLRLAQTNAQLSAYKQQEYQRQQMAAVEQMKMQAAEGIRQRAVKAGLKPDDPRIVIDFDEPDRDEFFNKAWESITKAREEDAVKSLEDRLTRRLTEEATKIRKETGVDSHETPGTVTGNKTFTRAQIKDRKFYLANKDAIDAAAREGRIKE